MKFNPEFICIVISNFWCWKRESPKKNSLWRIKTITILYICTAIQVQDWIQYEKPVKHIQLIEMTVSEYDPSPVCCMSHNELDSSNKLHRQISVAFIWRTKGKRKWPAQSLWLHEYFWSSLVKFLNVRKVSST